MPELPSVSVVVPTYNGVTLLERILRPLSEDPATSEVIVVVDGSRDGSKELVDRLARDEPRLRSLLIENAGDMGARDVGAQAAGSEIVLFVDDDVLADPGLVSGHARRHAEAAADIIVGYMPVAVSPRRGPDDFALMLYAGEYEGRCRDYERDPASVAQHLWGGNFSMRRAHCLAVGMSNPGFTEHYHGDREFGLRCLEAGLTGVFDRDLSAAHLHDRTLDSFVRDARSQGAARVLMPAFHPAIMSPPEPGEFAQGLPEPVAAVVRLCRRPRAHAATSASLRRLIGLAGVARLWLVQDCAASLLRRIEQQQGAIEQSRGARP
jgi:GT2 family glycosyltransferase